VIPRRVLVVALAVAFLLGCASARVRPDVEYRQSRGSYLKVLGNWTRSVERFDGLETDALVAATYFSEPIVRAYAGEKARAESLPAEEAAGLLETMLADRAQVIRFRVAFYTVDRAWNDLDKVPSSWRLYLVTPSGAKVEPLSVTRQKVDPASEALYFPQTSPWTVTYVADFPRQDADGKPLISETDGEFRLLVAGAKARAELVWRLDR
jgi:hypothetical protein